MGEFLLKKERAFFFGVLPSKYSGSVAWRNAIWTGQSKTIFAGGKGFALPRLFCADFCIRRAGNPREKQASVTFCASASSDNVHHLPAEADERWLCSCPDIFREIRAGLSLPILISARAIDESAV